MPDGRGNLAIRRQGPAVDGQHEAGLLGRDGAAGRAGILLGPAGGGVYGAIGGCGDGGRGGGGGLHVDCGRRGTRRRSPRLWILGERKGRGFHDGSRSKKLG